MADIFDGLIHEWDKLTHAPSQAPAAIPASLEPTQGGKPVSAVAEARNGLHDVLGKLEAIDEAIASKMEALQGNPGAMKIVDAALAAAHVPPEGFDVVVATLQGLADLYSPQQPVQAPAAPVA